MTPKEYTASSWSGDYSEETIITPLTDGGYRFTFDSADGEDGLKVTRDFTDADDLVNSLRDKPWRQKSIDKALNHLSESDAAMAKAWAKRKEDEWNRTPNKIKKYLKWRAKHE